MRYLHGLLSTLVVVTALAAVPARVHAQAAPQAQAPHDHDHQGAAEAKPATTPEQRQHMMMNMMADMQAADAKLNALVETMNTAKGAEKTEAIAALLTAIVKEHGAMRGSMMNMMNMMSGMGGMRGTAPGKTKP